MNMPMTVPTERSCMTRTVVNLVSRRSCPAVILSGSEGSPVSARNTGDSSSAAQNDNTNHGFTLIELVLVIGLIGVMAVAATVMVINWKRSEIEVVARKVQSDIEYARSLAMMKRGTTFGVFFNNSTDQYTVYEGGVGSPVPDPQTKQNLIEDFSRWPGVTITGGNYTVEFNQFGVPTTGGGGSVQVTDGTNTKTIAVDASTGRVSIQ